MIVAGFFGCFAAGLFFGQWLAHRRWRQSGDHAYMNRMESAGRLYTVKREP